MKTFLLLSTLLIVAYSLAAGQQSNDPPNQAPGSDLVAWSQMQAPEPIPQQSPSANPTPDPQPETQPQQNPTPSTQPGQATSAGTNDTAETLVGTIGKDAGAYVLRVSDSTSYKLDNQDQAKQFDGQRVRSDGNGEYGTQPGARAED